MAEAGASLVLVGRDIRALEESAGGLAVRGGARHILSVTDVSQPAAVEALSARVLAEFGRADILVNNAGFNVRKPLLEFSFEEWRSVVETNLFGAMLCSQALIPPMIRQSWGRILNMGSIMARVALPGRTAYCASKGGLVAMTRSLALEMAPHKITVNAISPGPFATEMNRPFIEDPAKNAEFLSKIPLGRWGNVDEVGSLAVFLASEAAGFITGADILIDGGWSAQ